MALQQLLTHCIQANEAEAEALEILTSRDSASLVLKQAGSEAR
jgi:hypothetical protein